MDIVSAFLWIAYFTAIYGVMIGIGWLVDRFLWKRFGKGIFPKDYFR
jgi:H+/Cl- antiporter ClcA